MAEDLKPANPCVHKCTPEATSAEAIRKMIEGLQRRNYLAGSDAAIAWLEAEIRRDVGDGVW